MRRIIPLILLWLSLIYLVIAFGVTSTGCFFALFYLHGGLGHYNPGDWNQQAWMTSQVETAFSWFWALCMSVGLGILLVAISSLLVSLTRRAPVPTAEAAGKTPFDAHSAPRPAQADAEPSHEIRSVAVKD
jgi:hypothetical protein